MVPSLKALPLAAMVLLTGCPERKRVCAPGTAALVSVRDGAGVVVRTLKPSADGKRLELCDAAHQRTGTLLDEGKIATLLDAQGKRVLRIETLPDGDLEAEGPTSARLRVHKGATEVRVLKPDGVAFGALSSHDGGATVFDQASAPIASVITRGAEHVLRNHDGTARAYVAPGVSTWASAVFALDALSPDEQLALYRLFTR
jgi:hypothetical protein